MGIVLAIVGAISTTVPSTTALIDAAWFAAGVSLAVLLSCILWPVWTHLPVRRAVARVYEELAAYAAEIRATLEAGKRDQWHCTDLALGIRVLFAAPSSRHERSRSRCAPGGSASRPWEATSGSSSASGRPSSSS